MLSIQSNSLCCGKLDVSFGSKNVGKQTNVILPINNMLFIPENNFYHFMLHMLREGDFSWSFFKHRIQSTTLLLITAGPGQESNGSSTPKTRPSKLRAQMQLGTSAWTKMGRSQTWGNPTGPRPVV